MNADQIKSAVLSAMQVVTDEMGLGLAVGPVNELDWAYLSGGFGHLNWEAGLTEYGNMEWSFDVALKLQSDTRLLNAAILGVFKPETDTLEMHFVESFIRREEQHQLKGRVFEMMIIASFLYVAAVGGSTVRLMDVTCISRLQIWPLHSLGLQKVTKTPIEPIELAHPSCAVITRHHPGSV